MKLKLAISLAVPALIMLGSTGCVTGSTSYSRDIVYRDGSYYSPADDQNGDYYYEPEPDYSYDDYDSYYGFNSIYYGNAWYGHQSCHFSYHYDRYCNNGWGSVYLNFGGLTIGFGNSNYYGYGYGYGYPYYGYYYSPRPHHDGPIPMPKPGRPIHQTPDYGLGGPGMRVPGEPIRMPIKPGVVDSNPVEPVVGAQDEENRNPYIRHRRPQPIVQPQIWAENDNADPRMQTKPALLVEDGTDEPSENPAHRERRPLPYPVNTEAAPSSGVAPTERDRRDDRHERAAPRVQQRERVQRIERVERSERRVRISRPENNDRGSGDN